MSKPLRIFCLDFSEIPAIDKIVALVTNEQHLVLQFPRSAERFDPDAIIDDLSQRLKDCTVFYSGATHETENISIVRVIQEQVVLENASLFLNAIRNYSLLASKLIDQLAENLNFSPEDVSANWIFEVDKTIGKLEGGWEYMFHGDGCRFRNSTTAQIVDMRLRDYKNRQAIPDPYFFAQYVRTTKSETNISNLIRHEYHDMARALNVLSKAGYLPLEN